MRPIVHRQTPGAHSAPNIYLSLDTRRTVQKCKLVLCTPVHFFTSLQVGIFMLCEMRVIVARTPTAGASMEYVRETLSFEQKIRYT
jgi:hypothetical protein